MMEKAFPMTEKAFPAVENARRVIQEASWMREEPFRPVRQLWARTA